MKQWYNQHLNYKTHVKYLAYFAIDFRPEVCLTQKVCGKLHQEFARNNAKITS